MADRRRPPLPPEHPLASVPPEDLAEFGYRIAKLMASIYRAQSQTQPAAKAA